MIGELTIQQILVLVAGTLVNITLFMCLPTFIYFVVRYPAFRDWVMDMIEDSDDKPHKSDAKDAVLLFFAFMMGWVLVDIIFIMMHEDKDWLQLIITVAGIMSVLFGISKYEIKK